MIPVISQERMFTHVSMLQSLGEGSESPKLEINTIFQGYFSSFHSHWSISEWTLAPC